MRSSKLAVDLAIGLWVVVVSAVQPTVVNSPPWPLAPSPSRPSNELPHQGLTEKRQPTAHAGFSNGEPPRGFWDTGVAVDAELAVAERLHDCGWQ